VSWACVCLSWRCYKQSYKHGQLKITVSSCCRTALANASLFLTSTDHSFPVILKSNKQTNGSDQRLAYSTQHNCRITATSPICHPTASSRTAPPAQLLWLTGFLCGCSVGPEFAAGHLAGSDYWWEQFQAISEDVSVRNVLMHTEVSRRCTI